jgi:hypothetical protein
MIWIAALVASWLAKFLFACNLLYKFLEYLGSYPRVFPSSITVSPKDKPSMLSIVVPPWTEPQRRT